MLTNRFIMSVPIAAGWSADRKFCVTDADGTKYLLRISSPEKEAYKRLEFQMMESVAALGIPMSRPVEFGVCEEGVYSLQSWIDGMDLSEALKPMGAVWAISRAPTLDVMMMTVLLKSTVRP